MNRIEINKLTFEKNENPNVAIDFAEHYNAIATLLRLKTQRTSILDLTKKTLNLKHSLSKNKKILFASHINALEDYLTLTKIDV